MRRRNSNNTQRSRVLVLVDESNVGSSVRTAGRGLDWLKLRDFLAGPSTGRDLIEMVVYAGLPPAIPAWQEERDKKNKFALAAFQWIHGRDQRWIAGRRRSLQGERGRNDGDRRARAFHRDAARCCHSCDWRRRFRLSRHQAAPTRDSGGGGIRRAKSRAKIAIIRERSDRSGAAVSHIRDDYRRKFAVAHFRAAASAAPATAAATAVPAAFAASY